MCDNKYFCIVIFVLLDHMSKGQGQKVKVKRSRSKGQGQKVKGQTLCLFFYDVKIVPKLSSYTTDVIMASSLQFFVKF